MPREANNTDPRAASTAEELDDRALDKTTGGVAIAQSGSSGDRATLTSSTTDASGGSIDVETMKLKRGLD